MLIPFARPGLGLLVFVAGMLGVAAGAIAGNVISASFRQAYCPPGLLGRVLTSMQFVTFGAIPVGVVLGGALAGPLGTRGAILLTKPPSAETLGRRRQGDAARANAPMVRHSSPSAVGVR